MVVSIPLHQSLGDQRAAVDERNASGDGDTEQCRSSDEIKRFFEHFRSPCHCVTES